MNNFQKNSFQKKQNYGIQYTVKPTFICNLILQLTSDTVVCGATEFCH